MRPADCDVRGKWAEKLIVTKCELCDSVGGEVLACAPEWRVVRVADADFPAFYRVIWQAHVAEFSLLSTAERVLCMEVVARVEAVLRDLLRPTKVNLASFGNMVPHLHWHVVARFEWDSHYPQSPWGPRQRDVLSPAATERLILPLSRVDAALKQALRTL